MLRYVVHDDSRLSEWVSERVFLSDPIVVVVAGAAAAVGLNVADAGRGRCRRTQSH